MLKRFVARISFIAALLALVAVPVTVSAATFDLHNNVNCAGAGDSTVCQTTASDDPVSGKNGVLRNVTRLIAVIAGIAAAVIMVLGGIKYITSNGDAQAVSRAKSTIIFAAVGLVVIVAAQWIIGFVISKV